MRALISPHLHIAVSTCWKFSAA